MIILSLEGHRGHGIYYTHRHGHEEVEESYRGAAIPSNWLAFSPSTLGSSSVLRFHVQNGWLGFILFVEGSQFSHQPRMARHLPASGSSKQEK
jgi:hypothetical protein